jgi:AcrR family transcriptional regulator
VNDPKALTAKQATVIPYLLAAPSFEEGCKRAGVSKTTAYTWLKEEIFRQELRRQRDELIERALDSLKANVSKATETLVKLLDSESEPMQARAAEDIIEFAQKAFEHEELEKRIEALEERLLQQGGNYR